MKLTSVTGSWIGLGILFSLVSLVPGVQSATFGPDSYRISNPFYPLNVGARFVYQGVGSVSGRSAGHEVKAIETVDGVRCVKVSSTGPDGSLYEWFAQDTSGAVWRLRQYDLSTKEYDEEDYLQMPARPSAGERDKIWILRYEVVSLDATVTTPAGTFSGCLQLRCIDAAWPGEEEFYAPGIGEVKALDPNGGYVLASYSHVNPPASRTSGSTQGTYDVWGGSRYDDMPSFYNVDKYDYVKLGTADGVATFQGSYPYYVVAVRGHYCYLDAAQGSDGTYYPDDFVATGNVPSDSAANVFGPPDGACTLLLGTPQGAGVGTYDSFVVLRNPGRWNSITVYASSSSTNASITKVVSGPGSALWDLTSLASVMNHGFVIEKSGQTRVTVAYPMDFDQDGSGKLVGGGETIVQLGYLNNDNQWVNLPPFLGIYKLTGSVTSSRGGARGAITATVAGSTLFEGATRRLTAAQKISFVVDASSKQCAGLSRDSASAAGKGSVSGVRSWGPYSLSSLGGGDGSWTLALNPATAGKNITGAASITMQSGRAYTFTVKGLYNANKQQSKLLLTGTALAKGSNLQVTLSGSTITAIKGKISGQMVNVSF